MFDSPPVTQVCDNSRDVRDVNPERGGMDPLIKLYLIDKVLIERHEKRLPGMVPDIELKAI
jgi:hypothetical protein